MELDRSEKGALSYALGQAMASIFCAQALGVTHLLHVDRYAVHHGLSFGSGRSRADLFGPGGKGWVVAEAKGRSNNTDGDLVKKLQTQKRTVKSILGSTPWVALGSVACFPDPKYRSLSVLTWDPEDEEHEAIRIEGSLDQFFIAYYAPILVAIESGSEVNYDNREFVTARLDGLALTVGLRSDLYRTLVRRLRPGVPGASAGDLARIALRERYPFFAGNREPDEMEVPIPPPTSDDFDQGHSGATRPGSELAARDQPGSQVFADGTVFATDWGAGTSLDDWHEQ